jgi:HEAT repeat protein
MTAFLVEEAHSEFTAVVFAGESFKFTTGERVKGMRDPKLLGFYSTNACSATPFLLNPYTCSKTTMLPFLLLLAAPAIPSANPPPSKEAWAILKDGASDKNAARRAKAVHSLGLIKDRQAERMAEEALSDPDKDVRSEAAVSLGHMNAAAARPKLRACLDDKDVLVVLACTNALYVLKDPVAYEVYYALLTKERKSSKGLMQSQLDTLRDRKQLEKLAFETGIGFVPYGGAGWQAIKTIAHDDVSPVRALAAERLATDPDPKSAKALTDYLTDKKARVREAVVEAIAKRDDPRFLKAVIDLLDDENDSIRYDAAATVIGLSQGRATRRAKTTTPRAAGSTNSTVPQKQ